MVKNLLIIDSSIPAVDTFINGLNDDTLHVLYTINDTFEILKERIQQLNASSFQHIGFVFVDEHSPLKMFVSYNTFISYNDTGIIENNTTLFIKDIVTRYSPETLDFLACNLLSYDTWKKYFEYLISQNEGLIVRASEDRTGNLTAGGNWVLESTFDDVTHLYFKDEIGEWNYLLDLGDHSAMVGIDGRVYTCGNNNSGQLGRVVSNNNNTSFQVVPDISDVVMVSTGLSHTAILKKNGEVWACGDNSSGQLGDGTTSNRSFFVQSKLISVASSGQLLGRGRYVRVERTEIIANISNLINLNEIEAYDQNGSKFNAISASASSVLSPSTSYSPSFLIDGVRTNSTDAFGYYHGIEDYTGPGTQWCEIDLGVNQDIYAIGIYNRTNGSLDRAQGLSVFIRNNDGEITYTSPQISTIQASYLYGFDRYISDATAIACGNNHTVIIREVGVEKQVWACGRNLRGQIGDGTFDDRSFFVQSVKSSSLTDFITDATAIACGAAHTVIIREVGTERQVWACGNNGNGQLGDGTIDANGKSFFIQSKESSNVFISNATTIACGSFYTVIIREVGTERQAWGCGANIYGQLGVGTINDNRVYFDRSKESSNPDVFISNATAIACGQRHTVIIREVGAEKQVWVCGFNTSGQLGDGTTIDRSFFVRSKESSNPDVFISNATAVVCGFAHTVIIREVGVERQVWTCGNNSIGQLGDGTFDDRSFFVQSLINPVQNVKYTKRSIQNPIAAGFVNLNTSNVSTYFPDMISNTISIADVTNTSTNFDSFNASNKKIVKLEPTNTVFSDYISFDIINLPENRFVYFKSETDLEPVQLGTNSDNEYGAYYTTIDSTTIKIYTKHFSEIAIIPVFDTTFTFNVGSRFNDIIYALALDNTNKILVGSADASNTLVRLNSNGALDSSFNVSPNTTVNSIAALNDNSIIIGGEFTSVNGQNRDFIARVHLDNTYGGSLELGKYDSNAFQPMAQIIGAPTFYDSSTEGQLDFLTRRGDVLQSGMTITNTGNVGIGTSAPISKLHVDGRTYQSLHNYSSVSGYYALDKDKQPIVSEAYATKAVSTWTTRTSANNNWRSVVWSPELRIFVAVATSGIDRVMTSPDGITWTTRNTVLNHGWIDVTWAAECPNGIGGYGLFVAVAESGSGNRVITSPDGINWTARTSAADTNSWHGVCWSPELNIFVAVSFTGTNNRVMTSPDGITWTSRTSAANNQWLDVTWAAECPNGIGGYGLFVAVANTGSGNRVMTSPDGINWTIRITPVNNDWRGIVWSPELGLFVVVSTSLVENHIMTSTDGITWTSRTAANNQWTSITWSPELGIFVAVANTGDNRIMTSPDGFNWTARITPVNNEWRSVVWSPELGIFVAVAATGSNNRVMTSALKGRIPTSYNVFDNEFNSISETGSWSFSQQLNASSFNASTIISEELFASQADISSLTVYDRTYQSIQNYSSVSGYYALDKDKQPMVSEAYATKAVSTWTSRTSAANNSWHSVVWSPELRIFVAVAYSGDGNRVMTSPDGINWTIRTSAADNQWTSVCWSPELGIFVAVANSGANNRIMTSPNGITWTIRTSAANYWRSVCWASELGIFVAVAELQSGTEPAAGAGQLVMTSPNGIDWTIRTSAADNNWHSVCWSPELGIFVAVAYSGQGNRVMTSPNGINWTIRTSAANNTWRSVVWSAELGIFVAVASGGGIRVMISSDGINWTTQTSPSSQAWYYVCWSPELGIFVAVAFSGQIMSSPNGINWTLRTSPANQWLSVTWSPELGIFVAVAQSGQNNRVMTSALKGRIPTSYNVFDNEFNSISETGSWSFSQQLNASSFNASTIISDELFASQADISSLTVYDRTYQSIQNYSSVSGYYALDKDKQPIVSEAYATKAVSTWTSRTSASGNFFTSVCWSPELRIFVAVAPTSAMINNQVMTSPDGINWTSRTAATSQLWWSVTWSSELGIFVAVSFSEDGNRVMTSSNGINWTTRTSAADNEWWSVTWSSELRIFVAVAGSGVGNRVMTSPNGIVWTIRSSAEDNDWRSVTWSPELGLFVVVARSGAGNRVMTSPNGIVWTIRSSAANNEWISVTWSPELGIFVAVSQTGSGDRVMTSPDGINWTIRTSANNDWQTVVWSSELGIFVAVANAGTAANRIMTSPDGINWTIRTSPAGSWHSIVWSPELGIFVAVGTGVVMTSALKGRIPTSYNVFDNEFNSISETGSWSFSQNVGIGTTIPQAKLDVDGDIRVSGRIIDESGAVGTSITRFVNAGNAVVLGIFEARIPSSGNRSLQFRVNSGSYSVYGKHLYVANTGVAANRRSEIEKLTLDSNWRYWIGFDNFFTAGDISKIWLVDDVNQISWKIECIIGPNYNNNIITIKRLR